MAVKAALIHQRHTFLLRLHMGEQRRGDQGDLPERRHRRRHGGRGIIKGGPNTEGAEEDARRSAEAEEDAMTRTLAD
jgi:hypothetical protein